MNIINSSHFRLFATVPPFLESWIRPYRHLPLLEKTRWRTVELHKAELSSNTFLRVCVQDVRNQVLLRTHCVCWNFYYTIECTCMIRFQSRRVIEYQWQHILSASVAVATGSLRRMHDPPLHSTFIQHIPVHHDKSQFTKHLYQIWVLM